MAYFLTLGAQATAATLLALSTVLCAADVRAQSSPQAKRVSASAWYVEGLSAIGSAENRNFVSNAGFIVTKSGVIVIDALGSPQLAREMIKEIARVTGKKVSHVIVTHYHADHIYGLQEFKRVGARVIAHRRALGYLHSELAASRLQASRSDLAPWVNGLTRLVSPDEWVDGPREIVAGGTRLRLIPVGPAHTPEDLMVFLPSERVLFAGDLMFRGRLPFVGQAKSGEWVAALDQMLALGADVVVPGHGPVSLDPRAHILLTRDYLVYLRQTMGRAAREMEPFEEAYARVDWSRFEDLPLFRFANRMNAYNTYLLMEQEGK